MHARSPRCFAAIALVAALFVIAAAPALAGTIDPTLAQTLDATPPMQKVRVIAELTDQVDLRALEEAIASATAPGERITPAFRYATVLNALQQVADRTQPGLMNKLASFESRDALTVHYRFWIRNMIVVSATPDAIRALAGMPEVGVVYTDGFLQADKPVRIAEGVSAPEASEPGLRAINAHRLWALGYNGTGRIVMNIDTGVEGNNLSFNSRWRGAQPGVQPSWAWFDPETGTTFPTDGDGGSQHGTHTMGIMCGLYAGTNDTLGVAPGAQWIAAKTLNSSPHTSNSIAAFQWAANPDGNPGTLNDVPDAISCSWYDPNVASTQCDAAGGYAAVIDAVEALGTAVVFSAGNNGPGASTLTPPKNRIATAVNIFAVGAVNGNTSGYPIASFSSRGPSTCPGPDSLRIKPEVSAPGVSVRSAAGTNGFRTLDGTSMASPHVAGSIALLRSVAPFMTGTQIKRILMETAADLGPAGEDNDYGHGIIDLWAAYLALPLDQGYVKGQVTSGGSPLNGVSVDFADSVLQVGALSDLSGMYKVSARIDTPFTTATYTLRAQKFGYLTFTDTVTLALDDTVTRNIVMAPAPGGTLSVHAYGIDSTGIPAEVRIFFGGQMVVNGVTDSLTGLYSAPLPAGDYIVEVDPPSPYATRTFDPVTITAGSTTTVEALLRAVIEASPAALRDTLVVGQVRAHTLTLLNTTPDPVPFRVTDDNALRLIASARPKPASQTIYESYELPKDAADPHPSIPPPTEGRGGPDPFGYEWIDSDEPDGPVFAWTDITAVGTPVTTWTGTADDGRFITALPFSFPFYGSDYDSLKIVTNGWVGFEVASTSNAYSNVAIPAAAEPNTAIYGFWDDLNVTSGGTVHYYHDAANARFIVQWTNVPHYGTTTPGLYTFQIILDAAGKILVQYLDMQQTLNSSTIGIESAGGTTALQVAFNANYVHNNLAVLFRLPDASWISENPTSGTIPGNSTQDVAVTFDATGLTVGSTYNANVFVQATHPDATVPVAVPASLSIQLADSAVLILERATIDFPVTQVQTTAHDTLTVRNGGLQALVITSITSTNPVFAVTPASANVPPGDSVLVPVAFTPTTVGSDTGRIVFLSNSQGSPRIDVLLSGSSIGNPVMTVAPTSLSATLQVGDLTVRNFTVDNTGTPPTAPLIVAISEGADWLAVTPAADTLAAGGSGSFAATFSAAGLALGTYTTSITVAGNDPVTPTTEVACTLNVVGGPIISVSPDSLVQDVNSGTVVVDTLTIRNTGVSPLTWSMSELPSSPAVPPSAGPAPPALELPKDAPDTRTGPPVTEGQGGPDGFGYRWIDSDEPGGPAFDWFDISTVGTLISTWTGSDDDGRYLVPLPFAFTWYGTSYDSLKIVTNGWVGFDVASTSTAYSNVAIPAAAEPNNTIYGFWDDLDLDPLLGGSVHYYHDAANGRFIVQWTTVPHFGTTTPGLYTFQIILKATGEALVQYLDMQQTLNSATIGIENTGGTIGLQVAFNAAYVHNNLAVLYSRGISWLGQDPTSGTVNPNDSAKVAVTFNSTGLPGGTYRGSLQIGSNDLTQNPLNVPVRLHVIGVPGISVASAVPFGTVFVGDTAQANLVVRNVGSDDLTVSSFSIQGGGGTFFMNLDPVTIGIGDSIVRVCSFAPTAATPYAATCVIVSNDPDDDTVQVALSGTGSAAPSGSIWPGSITKVLQQGQVDSSSQFAIRNTGGSPLTWEISEVTATELVLEGDDVVNAPQPDADVAPVSLRFREGILAVGDTLFSIDVQTPATPVANVQLGVEFALGHYWVTGRSTTDNVKKLYKFDTNGALVASYPQGTTTTFGWRDLAYDGRYLYTSDENEFAKIDPLTGTKVGTLPRPAGQTVLRGLAFDPATRTFWTKNFRGALVHFDSTGATLGSFTNNLAAYGLAWDSWTPGGPFLWMFSQDGPVGGQKVMATQFNPATGQPTGVSFLGPNYTALPDTDIAGGASISNEVVAGKIVLLGLHQGTIDRVVAYDLTSGLPWVDASVTSGTTAPGDSSVVRAIFRTQGVPGGNYTGRFRVATNDPANPLLYVDLALDVLVSVDDTRPGIPDVFTLGQNYPNPFNPSTTIEFGVPEAASVTLRIFDVLGREVATLAAGDQAAGFYRVSWDGRNAGGAQVSSGIYFYRMEGVTVSGRSFSSLKKMLFMK